MPPDLWIFGYGSLIWRPDFHFARREPATIRGFARRFWQESPDHRGTPERPGRVVTLLPDRTSETHGVAYLVSRVDREAVLARLDHREKGGYRRVETTFHMRSGGEVRGLVYIATEDNPHYVGPTPIEEIARIAAERIGPSGHNRDYVLRLAAALDELGTPDAHVAAIAALLRAGSAHP